MSDATSFIVTFTVADGLGSVNSDDELIAHNLKETIACVNMSINAGARSVATAIRFGDVRYGYSARGVVTREGSDEVIYEYGFVVVRDPAGPAIDTDFKGNDEGLAVVKELRDEAEKELGMAIDEDVEMAIVLGNIVGMISAQLELVEDKPKYMN